MQLFKIKVFCSNILQRQDMKINNVTIYNQRNL